MKMELRCPKCGALIAERVPLDDKGNFSPDRELRMELEETGANIYRFLCPGDNCDGYVRAVPTRTSAGTPGLKILSES